MSERAIDIEAMLRQRARARRARPADLAAAPRDHPRRTLAELAAPDELEAWELGDARATRRNWPRPGRPAAAAVVGSAAAVGLVVLRTQRNRHRRRAQSHNVAELAVRTLRDGGREARRLLDELH